VDKNLVPRLFTSHCKLLYGCFKRPWQMRKHCCGHIVADTNVSPFARARNICCGHEKCFWFCSETFCVHNKCFPVCAAWRHNIHFVSRAFARPRNIMSNNVSATTCPCLQGTKYLLKTNHFQQHQASKTNVELRMKHSKVLVK